MNVWRPHTYRRAGEQRGIDETLLGNAIAVGQAIVAVNRTLPPLFSLRHLAYLADVDYGFLRAVVSRELSDPYKVFRIGKRSTPDGTKRFRIICVPDPELIRVQRWITTRILSQGSAHPASTAYSRGSSICEAAERHCSCKWMIKFDIVNFFESISEIGVYHAFRSFGYQPLVAFEMSRICTRLGTPTPSRLRKRWQSNAGAYAAIPAYRFSRMGHLPQGAPTSPMLANFAVYDFDKKMQRIAENQGLIYTRYADDLTISTSPRRFNRARIGSLISDVYSAMGEAGFSPNKAKIRVVPPGARKIVLGLLVDLDKPRLPRKFKASLRQHLYYIAHPDVGPAKHAARRGFVSVLGFRHHIEGLIAFARQIEPAFGAQCAQELVGVWPL
jgi:RNA-directed DNA polymerase